MKQTKNQKRRSAQRLKVRQYFFNEASKRLYTYLKNSNMNAAMRNFSSDVIDGIVCVQLNAGADIKLTPKIINSKITWTTQ